MRILVTGGSGFLGSHVADALSVAGHDVTILDIRESPHLRQNQNMIVGDIQDPGLLETAVEGQDVVYHFAGIADVDECARRPVDTVKYNILGTAQLLEKCCQANTKRFVFASSAYVYSDHGYFYRTSKKACESLIEDYFAIYGLKYTCMRYGSLYGERADDHNSI
jgi:UDP-glucose 4-epimerase